MNVIHRLSTTRAILVGAGVLLFGLGAFATTTSRCGCQDSQRVDRWVLQVDRDPDCYYGSSFNDGDLMMQHHDLVPTTFTHRYHHVDDCTWEVVETLVPDGANHFHYQYDERPTECAEGAAPLPACPLSGSVTVLPTEE